ncbi:hypothetical protein [Pontibacter pamirensis]|uniref:hypothetical protein n=1 Tax=Pontibacter pamirensis TaxID=2562824 RepID=UPI001389D11F|nr:hypothetical protein [Pontibacter pamirensis]
MKKALSLTLLALVFAVFTACGNQEDNRAANQVETGTDINSDIEADTAITLDPDTTTYHDMTL